ncbi:hypothetical protein [Clostridium cylindrosporum]|uniref:Uncharacterized protein n=1 Tax=Clostridium cylindrosporum DSM 605 TaxID=1121307 RepID=A0A0J8G6B2_CLOCY|nr:hypothetical protein [Clostridium cylindrosporum]KMT23146.1 hypothetical protein CLCY_6c00270 [Clostridium cylindrosporum DSM 605]
MKSIELFFELMDYEFLILVAQRKNIKINGFMNIKKAPKSLIRNVIKMNFSNKKKFQELLYEIFNEKSQKYKGKSLEEFLSELYLSSCKNKYGMFETFAIFMNLFPEDAERLCEKISINIESGKHIFSGLLVNDGDITEENCLSIVEKYLNIEDEISFLENNVESIEEHLLKLGRISEYTRVRSIIKDKSIVDICRELGDLSESFDESLLWLAFISLNIDYIKGDQNKVGFFNKLLFNILQRINKDLLMFNGEKIDCLEGECLNKNNEIALLNKNINSLKEEISRFEMILKGYEENIKSLEYKIMKNESFNLNEYNPDIIIITNYVPDRIMDSIGNYKIIPPDFIETFSNYFSNFKGVVFIDRGSIDSTKNLLILEDYLIALKLKKITIFSKSIEELTQNIIISKFTMEG